jgi:hypothetical protein
LFPFVNVWALYIGEGMGNFLPQVLHDGVCGIHELIKVEFVEELIGLLSVSVKGGGFFSLKGFVISSNRVWVPWELWWRSWRWRWRRWSSEWFL